MARDADIETGEAPLFVLHGTSDDVVLHAEAIELTERARSVGVPYTFYSVTDGEHDYSGIEYEALSVNGQSMLKTTALFVNVHLKGGSPVYETRGHTSTEGVRGGPFNTACQLQRAVGKRPRGAASFLDQVDDLVPREPERQARYIEWRTF